MNQRIDFTNLGGFPFTEDTLDFMQGSYRNAIQGLAQVAGDSVIVSGMIDNGNAVTAGWIVLNGNLMPFLAGPKQATFIVETLTGDRVFNDGSTHTVLFTQQARFGSGAGSIPYANLTRLQNLAALRIYIDSLFTSNWHHGDIIEIDVTAVYLADNFDATGLGKNERLGWAICNGQNGTRNRGGRFPVGFDPTNPDFAAIGNTGGNNSLLIAQANLPNVSINIPIYGQKRGSGTDPNDEAVSKQPVSGFGTPGNLATDPLGSSQPIDNRPAYIVSCWIMKL